MIVITSVVGLLVMALDQAINPASKSLRVFLQRLLMQISFLFRLPAYLDALGRMAIEFATCPIGRPTILTPHPLQALLSIWPTPKDLYTVV